MKPGPDCCASASALGKLPSPDNGLPPTCPVVPARRRAPARSPPAGRPAAAACAGPRKVCQLSCAEPLRPGGIGPPVDLLDQRRIGGEQRAAEQVGMAVQRLGRRMQDEVAAERERPLAARRRQRVVGDDQRAGRLGRRGARGDVDDPQQRIARRLDPDQRRLLRASAAAKAASSLWSTNRAAQLALLARAP